MTKSFPITTKITAPSHVELLNGGMGAIALMRERTCQYDALFASSLSLVVHGIVVVFAELLIGHPSNGRINNIAKIACAFIRFPSKHTIHKHLVHLFRPPFLCFWVGEIDMLTYAFPPFTGLSTVHRVTLFPRLVEKFVEADGHVL